MTSSKLDCIIKKKKRLKGNKKEKKKRKKKAKCTVALCPGLVNRLALLTCKSSKWPMPQMTGRYSNFKT